jgi:glucose-1-phosphate cytidylyltransferase
VKTVILCGGRGLRLLEHAGGVPKPLLAVGGKPILWHVMKLYAQHGQRDFVLCVGPQQAAFEEFAEREAEPDWRVEVAGTGDDTPTGGRIQRVASRLDGEDFLVSYGDGVADVDLRRLLDFHRSHDGTATVTVVRRRAPFGVVELGENGRALSFVEKPLLSQWASAGYFVFRRGVFDYLDEASELERDALERLAADGELHAYRHDGFWAGMDTLKDHIEVNELWNARAPWKVWED